MRSLANTIIRYGHLWQDVEMLNERVKMLICCGVEVAFNGHAAGIGRMRVHDTRGPLHRDRMPIMGKC
jgi:hypothetical protein